MFAHLREANIHRVYREAGKIISARGMSKSMTYDPYTKSVDIEGAILLACGASEKLLSEGHDEIYDLGIPEANIIKVLLGIEYIEAMTDSDIAEWCQNNEKFDAIKLLDRLADRIEITFVRKTN